MLKQVEYQALVALRLIERLQREGEVLSPSGLARQGLMDVEWKALGIDREFPFDVGAAPKIYRAFALLASWGLLDDFTSFRDLAKELGLDMASVQVLRVLRGNAKGKNLTTILHALGLTDVGVIYSAIERSSTAGMITRIGESGYRIEPSGVEVLRRFDKMMDVIERQQDFTAPYQINEAGRAFAATLGDDWGSWQLPAEAVANG